MFSRASCRFARVDPEPHPFSPCLQLLRFDDDLAVVPTGRYESGQNVLFAGSGTRFPRSLVERLRLSYRLVGANRDTVPLYELAGTSLWITGLVLDPRTLSISEVRFLAKARTGIFNLTLSAVWSIGLPNRASGAELRTTHCIGSQSNSSKTAPSKDLHESPLRRSLSVHHRHQARS